MNRQKNDYQHSAHPLYGIVYSINFNPLKRTTFPSEARLHAGKSVLNYYAMYLSTCPAWLAPPAQGPLLREGSSSA